MGKFGKNTLGGICIVGMFFIFLWVGSNIYYGWGGVIEISFMVILFIIFFFGFFGVMIFDDEVGDED